MNPHREHFWNVDGAWLFYLLAALALAAFGWGVWSRVRQWRRASDHGQRWNLGKLLRAAVDGLSGRRIFRGDRAAGVLHALILWGFTLLFLGTVLATLDHYVFGFLSGTVYVVYAFVLDVAGVMLLVGLLWAGFRRYVTRAKRLENRLEDLVVLAALAFVALTGYLVEALRLAALEPVWSSWSFAGDALTGLGGEPSSAEAAYPVVWWLHAAASLALIAAIPYTKLFHALAGPAHLSLAGEAAPVIPIDEAPEGAAVLPLRASVALDACTRCGRCVEVCPATQAGEPFAPRTVLTLARQQLQLGEDAKGPGLLGDAALPWHCTTCLACLEACPLAISTPEVVREARRAEVEDGTRLAPALTRTLETLGRYQNPWETSKKKRGGWAKGLGLTELGKKKGAPVADLLCYWVGCTTAVETRARGMAKAFVEVLRRAGVDFGILAKKEPCCGDIARRLGEDGLFEEQAEKCGKLFDKSGIRDVVTSSPHCFHSLRNELPAIAPSETPRVRHYTELLAELVGAGKLPLDATFEARVTYHDPCYLGRHNGIYDAPRRVLAGLPGVELIEMGRRGSESLCCGGGGGRMWQEELDADTKMSEVRIREAAQTGAQLVVTACPLCLIMLDDARKTAGFEERLRVVDLNELLVMALADQPEREEA